MPVNPFTSQMVHNLAGQVGNSLTQVWTYFVRGRSNNIAQGGRASFSVPVNAATDIFIQQIQFDARYNVATTPAGMVLGGKIPREVRDTVATHTDNDIGKIDLLFSTLNRPWMNQPVRANLITGEADAPYYLPSMIYVAGNDVIQVEVMNNLATIGAVNPAIDVEVCFVCVNASRAVLERMQAA